MDTEGPGQEKGEPGKQSEEPPPPPPKRDEKRERREHEEFMRRWRQAPGVEARR